jgi:hypothetical protein
MKGTVRGSAVSISGMKESPIENYYLTDVKVEARSSGEISFASGWKFKNVSITARDSSAIKVQNSLNMEL